LSAMPSCAHVAHGTHVGEQHPVAECDRHVVGKATEPQEQVALRTAKVATMAISSLPPSTVINIARWSRRCSGEEKGWKERDEAWCCRGSLGIGRKPGRLRGYLSPPFPSFPGSPLHVPPSIMYNEYMPALARDPRNASMPRSHRLTSIHVRPSIRRTTLMPSRTLDSGTTTASMPRT
jgi:hypothetical protein